MISDKQFAQRILDAFEQAGHFSDDQVRAAGGPSSTSMTALRKAARGEIELRPPRGDLLERIDRAAGWRKGSARAFRSDGIDPKLDSTTNPYGIDLSDYPVEELLAELQRRTGVSEGRASRSVQDDSAAAPDAEGPEEGA